MNHTVVEKSLSLMIVSFLIFTKMPFMQLEDDSVNVEFNCFLQ